MRKLKTFYFFLIPLILLAFGELFVSQRTSENPVRYLQIRGDTGSYVEMIKGDFMKAAVPKRHRVLVPLLARLVPLSPTGSLKFITYFSLWVVYTMVLLTCRSIGINDLASVCGLLVVYCSGNNLYNFHNPYLVDAFGLMVLSVMFYAFLWQKFSLFFAVSVVGVLGREVSLFLAPVWVLLKRREGMIVLVSTFLAFLVLRILIPGERFTEHFLQNIHHLFSLSLLFKIASTAGLSWSFVWLLAAIGFILIPESLFRPLFQSTIFLFMGAVALSLFTAIGSVNDTLRYFGLLFPVFGVLIANLVEVMMAKRYSNVLIVILAILAFMQCLLAFPNKFYGLNSFPFQGPLFQYLLLISGFAYSVGLVLFLKTEIAQQVREKVALGWKRVLLTGNKETL